MTIGALGAYGFQPYVYNTNAVSAASMNKLSKISDDVLDKKVDYSELADESKNVNPLKKGQTLDFQGMLAMQMQRGQSNAARIMRPMDAQAVPGAEEAKNPADVPAAYFDLSGAAGADNAEDALAEEKLEMTARADSWNINYQMQQALQAYEMFMTA